MRQTFSGSALAGLCVFACLSSAAIAQQAKPNSVPSEAAKPASPQTVRALHLAGVVSTCNMVSGGKVPIKDALSYTASGVSVTLTSPIFGGQIEGVNPTPSAEQIFNNSYISEVAIIKNSECYTKLNDADKQYIDKTIASVEQQLKTQSQGK